MISLNREYSYTGVLSHTFYCNFWLSGQKIVDRYTGSIVIPKIVKPGFHCKRQNMTNVLQKHS